MNILIIPDTHLKPWIFDQADKVIMSFKPDKVVILGDLVDDWNASLPSYEAMMERCKAFAKDHPDAIWLWGNHDVAYVSDSCRDCSGHIAAAESIVTPALNSLDRLVGGFKKAYHIDNVLFSHAGICETWVRYFPGKGSIDNDELVEWINSQSFHELWDDLSPIWYRPMDYFPLYKGKNTLQVVGHTPVRKIGKWKNAFFTDTFSTETNGKAIGSEDFFILDTKTRDGICVKADTLEYHERN